MGVMRDQFIRESDLSGRERVPFFIPFKPTANVTAGGSDTVSVPIGPRDFVCTHIAFRSDLVATVRQPFQIEVRDIGAQLNWQTGPFDVDSVVGPDKQAFQLATPWRFTSHSTAQVVFYNKGGSDTMPYLTLHGYLDSQNI